MTTVTVSVDNERNAALLEKMLNELSFVEKVNVDGNQLGNDRETIGSFEKLKRAIEKIDGNVLFQNINNPTLWQKKIRDEW